MRNVRILAMLSLVASLAFSGWVSGQEIRKEVKVIRHGGDMKCEISCGGESCMGLDLNQDQQKKVDALQNVLEKQMIALQADLRVKEAELQKLMVADNPSKSAVEKKVDEIGAVKVQIQKAHVNHRLAVRELLAPEQRVKFDNQGGCGGDMPGRTMMFIGEGDGPVMKHIMKDGPGKMMMWKEKCDDKDTDKVEIEEEK